MSETRHIKPVADKPLERYGALKDSGEDVWSGAKHGIAPAVAMAIGAEARGASVTLDNEPINIPRLRHRIHAYARAYDIPDTAVRQLDDMLDTALAVRLLSLPTEQLHDFLVLDAYKPRMHVMYDRYMTGVTAEFALDVRRAPAAANPATLPNDHPELWARFEASATALSKRVPYSTYEVQVLRKQYGLDLPKSLLDRCHGEGVAPVTWQQRHQAGEEGGGRVVMASGSLITASLMETPLMQSFQALAVAAQVESLTRGGTPSAPSAAPSAHPQPQPHHSLDRTERLANSLTRLALTVSRLNGLRHGCRVALFAGRRSSDLLYLVLQNLYCASHLDGYGGTSSVYVAAVVCREWARMGVLEPEQRGGVGPLVGTHAHEQVSAVQQLLAPYDLEAGRRCGLSHAVAVTPLLAHLLFLTANGGSGPDGRGATALADTFTTAAFLAVARAAAVPAAFRRDVEAAHGWLVPEHAKAFDLFRIWRLDSGPYEEVAEAVVAAWEARCGELRTAGLPELPRPHLMHSNLESVEHIAQVCRLDPRVKPHTLAFGTLADGFLPFLEPELLHKHRKAEQGPGSQERAAVQGQGQEQAEDRLREELEGNGEGEEEHLSIHALTAAPSRPTIGLASVVMKLVQARPPGPLLLPLPHATSAAGDADGTASAPSVLPACALKLGDGDSGKVQVDPRLPPAEAQAALKAAREMARGSATSRLDADALSAVLAEAYEAVTRGGMLMASAPR